MEQFIPILALAIISVGLVAVIFGLREFIAILARSDARKPTEDDIPGTGTHDDLAAAA